VGHIKVLGEPDVAQAWVRGLRQFLPVPQLSKKLSLIQLLNEPGLALGGDPGMALAPFPTCIG